MEPRILAPTQAAARLSRKRSAVDNLFSDTNLAIDVRSCHGLGAVEKPEIAVCFDRETFERRAQEHRQLLVEINGQGLRGQLDTEVRYSIEDALREEGALARSAAVSVHDREELLADQLYRAALIGRDGLALSFDALSQLAPEHVVCSDDSDALRHWCLASQARPRQVSVYLPSVAGLLRGYGQPVLLREVLFGALEAELNEMTATPAVASSELADSNVPAPAEIPAAPAPALPSSGPCEPEAGVPSTSLELALIQEVDDVAPLQCHPMQASVVSSMDELLLSPPATPREALSATPITPRARQKPVVAAQCGEAVEAAEPPEQPTLAERISTWCDALSRTHGTLSWEILERLYVTAYAPLEAALLAHPGSFEAEHEVLLRWGRQFTRCYTQAFERLRTGRQRPTMVFDAPKIAFHLTRAQLASGFKLVLVDAFRFSVGERVQDKLSLQLSGQAECVSSGVLWAPLPATTSVGLELLARGADGLRDVTGKVPEAEILSIKDARQMRKLRAGPHSLYKLDAVQASLEAGKSWDRAGIEQLAAEVSVSAGRFIRKQAAGTLILLFGDHGFRLEDGGHGGATPPEVLVPYQAWRVSDAAAVAAE